MSPDDLYELVGPSVEGPMPLIVVLDGWLEASETLARVSETIIHQADITTIARFDTDQLIDQRARRPMLTVIDGVLESTAWPELELSVGTDSNDTPFLLLHGPEPDYRWRPFGKAVVDITTAIGVSMMHTIGAYPAPMPHTRPVRISSTATNADMLTGLDHTTGSIIVPVGVFAAIYQELKAFDIETHGLWGQVPYYLSAHAWPHAPIAMLRHLQSVAGLKFDTSQLEAQTSEAESAVESMIDESPSLGSLVQELEKRYDELKQFEEGNLPSGDQLEEQLQQYLRKIDGE